jgi:hypothetical protein
MFGHGLSARFLNAMLDDELMNLGHIGTVPIQRPFRNVGVCGRELLEEYLILSY